MTASADIHIEVNYQCPECGHCGDALDEAVSDDRMEHHRCLIDVVIDQLTKPKERRNVVEIRCAECGHEFEPEYEW